jgi:hypothetical protein
LFSSNSKAGILSRPFNKLPGAMQELSLTATQQLQALASGKITAVELLEQTIARAE